MILWFSKMLLPLVISYVIAFGLISRRPIFDDFLDGAKSGMKTSGGHFADSDWSDYSCGGSAGIRTTGCDNGYLRGSSRTVLYSAGIGAYYSGKAGVQPQQATGLLLDMFRQYGPDSRIGMGGLCHNEQYRDGLLLSEYLFWQCKSAPDPLCSAGRTHRYSGRDCGQHLDYGKVKHYQEHISFTML